MNRDIARDDQYILGVDWKAKSVESMGEIFILEDLR
jgi:hypothetical protein